jgi:hypothetical protein
MEMPACRDLRGAAVVRIDARCACPTPCLQSMPRNPRPAIHVRMRRGCHASMPRALGHVTRLDCKACPAGWRAPRRASDAHSRDPVGRRDATTKGVAPGHTVRSTRIRARLRKKRHLNTGRGPGAGGFMRPRNARSAFQSRPDWVRVPAFAREAGCDANVLPRRLPGGGAGPRPPSTRSIQVLPRAVIVPRPCRGSFFCTTGAGPRIAMVRCSRNGAPPAREACD